jgi:membrane-associated protease RseP (regulator of RpoE activity)
MRMRLCLVAFILVNTLVLSWHISLFAQEPTYLIPVEMKGQTVRGAAAISMHGSDGSIGINGKVIETGYKVEVVVPGSPAANAGVLVGDTILSLDGTSLKGIETWEALKPIAQKKEGETVSLTINRNGEVKTINVAAALRKNVWANDAGTQQEMKQPPAISQFIFGGSAAISARLVQTEQRPSNVFLWVFFYSKDAPPFTADDLKFFVLDGTNQQLRHVSIDEIRYGIQLEAARNWKGGNYPPPPPPSPQRQYTISGMDNGNYTITNLGGGMASVSGTSSSTYTVTQQPDYSQLGYSLGLAIRQYRDNKSNQKLVEQAKEAIASWEGPYFKSQGPIVAGENRGGGIMYWTGSNQRPQPPYRVVLFLTDPRNQKEEHVTFAFGSGAEKIKEEMAHQVEAASTQSRPQSFLTNGDVVGMVKAGLSTDIIIAKIKATPCSFETNPTTLKELKDAGVPDSVILSMVQAPKN